MEEFWNGITAVSTVIQVIATIAIAWILQKFTTEVTRLENIRIIDEMWQSYNELIISDEKISEAYLTIDNKVKNLHELRELILVFNVLNIMHTMWRTNKANLIENKRADDLIKAQLNVLDGRIEIVEKALRYGYDSEFSSLIISIIRKRACGPTVTT